jgi:threonine synthase
LKIANHWRMECVDCGAHLESEPAGFACPNCKGLLQLTREEGNPPSRSELFGRKGEGIWRFRTLLPFDADVSPISLGEGGTPLIKTRNLSREIGLNNVHVKNEGQNPTASFKDRGMTASVTRAIQSGAHVLICASTGNTSASMSAYAARAGVKAVIIVPAGKVSAGKLVQAIAYGATIIETDGTFDDALSLTLEAASSLRGFDIMNSVNPYRIEGQKTVAFEIYEQLGFAVPDYVVMPVGNAGNLSAVWKGFKEMKESGIIDNLPRMVGVQAEGAAPIARAFWKGSDVVTPIDEPHTIASAIRIGNPASAKKALRALKESNGMVLTVTDDEIIQARLLLASSEGIFVEPASATPVAAMKEISVRLEKGAVVVCIATGNGLKDQETIEMNLDSNPKVSDTQGLVGILTKIAG